MDRRRISKAIFIIIAAAASLVILVPGVAAAQDLDPMGGCGQLDNAYGPFDYTNARDVAKKLPRVEKAHFDIGVQQLTGHRSKVFTWANLAADIDYTLRAFPNHHMALYAMTQYYLEGYDKQYPMRYSARCYFDRAKRNSPSDGSVYLVEGIYFARLGRLQDSENSYLTAINMMPTSSEARYNLGLLYLEMKNYPAAREQALKAYEIGYPMPGLRNKLQALGQWEN